MKPNLDTLKQEMHAYLTSRNIAVFQGMVADFRRQGLVLWDVRREPDFRKFIDCALQLGVKMMLLSHGELDPSVIDDALERLPETDLSPQERRALERRLKELKPFAGFTCSVELTFEYHNRFYLFDMRTEWYEELLEIVDQIDMAVSDGETEEESDDDSMYFSRN
ncbi:MAG: sugar phosphate isomerase/epimerase [Bryobacteraceae bacterium]|nr:sugar phosphate isomerase/epimerase [Bryobacteraceae bacterium]MDW8377396.1 hypothetical protein [Bryobacterales bacterium]